MVTQVLFLATASLLMSHLAAHMTTTQEQRIRGNVHNKEHIKEHYEGVADIDVNGMTEEELEFHYFREHDLDQDGRLDGLELLKAFSHELQPDLVALTRGLNRKDRMAKEAEYMEEWLNGATMLVDELLRDEDHDRDGYLSYLEYVQARRK